MGHSRSETSARWCEERRQILEYEEIGAVILEIRYEDSVGNDVPPSPTYDPESGA